MVTIGKGVAQKQSALTTTGLKFEIHKRRCESPRLSAVTSGDLNFDSVGDDSYHQMPIARKLASERNA